MISIGEGLAVASPNSLFAHDDEQGAVSEIDVASGRVMRSFTFGGRGDYEGIAAQDGRIFVITSEGMLSSFQIPRKKASTRKAIPSPIAPSTINNRMNATIPSGISRTFTCDL